MEHHHGSQSSERKRKRRKKTAASSWKDLPAFCDAAASVSATTFGSRRLPELKALWESSFRRRRNDAPVAAAVSLEPWKSGGGKTSSRHLRRRAASHLSRKRHRYPAGRPAADGASASTTKTAAAAAKTKLTTTTTITRQDEATSRPSRRARRRKRTYLQSGHEEWRKHKESNNNVADISHDVSNEGAQGASPTPTPSPLPLHWMKTHLWHAKRFHMEALWGWKVPMVHSNRGARASLRLAREGKSLLQDTTWRMQPIWISTATTTPVQNNNNNNNNQQQQSHFLFDALRRILPDISRSLDVDMMTEGKLDTAVLRAGEGMLHRVDEYPRGAVGPVTWLCSTESLLPTANDRGGNNGSKSAQDRDAEEEEEEDGRLHFYILTHPSIRSLVLDCVKGIVSTEGNTVAGDGDGISTRSLQYFLGGGVSFLQLRGRSTLSCLRKALDSLSNYYDVSSLEEAVGEGVSSSSSSRDEDDSTTMERVFQLLPHNTAFSIAATQSKNAASEQRPLVEAGRRKILIISHCPRNPALLCNAAVCGFNIICDPDQARQLFLALVLQGGACPIGLVEEMHCYLECDPPIPVFPRDYPDTAQGDSYWGLKSKDWKTVRQYGEAGWGRITPSRTETRTIEWENIVPAAQTSALSASSDQQSVVVIRGAFGEPLVNALQGCGSLSHPQRQHEPCGDDRYTSKKRRRRHRSTNSPVRAQLLSKDQAARHFDLCTSLSVSLSLPAVIMCHVRISGRGTVDAGASLLFLNRQPEIIMLGFATIGSFSSARGLYHGIGIVGTARLLEALAAATSHNDSRSSAVAVQRLDEKKEVCLQIHVRQPDNAELRVGFISLLL